MKMLPGGGHLIGTGPPPMVMHPGAGGGGTTVIHNHIILTLDGQKVATSVQTHQLRHARRNIATGIKLPGRAA